MAEILFIISAAALVYVYVLYPVILFASASVVQIVGDLRYVCHFKDRREGLEERLLPTISLVVAAYNEAQVIEQKILNSLSLDYPRDKLEIIIASDGSTDGTNEIVERYAGDGVRLFAYKDRGGKASVLNRSIPEANGEIIFLSDANTIYNKDSIKKLVRHFSDPGVGGYCGMLTLEPPSSGVTEESSYWRLENVLKFLESRINATLGANGGIYAIRKSAFVPISPDTIIDDFTIFMNVRKEGFTTGFDHEAVAYEETAPDLSSEYRRRIRIAAGNFQSIWHVRRFLYPLSGPIAFSLWSHKIMRWLVPLFLIVILFTNIILTRSGWLYAVTMGVQTTCYGLAAIGHFSRRSIIFKIPHYFTSMNIALLHGFILFLKGKQKAAWERTPR